MGYWPLKKMYYNTKKSIMISWRFHSNVLKNNKRYFDPMTNFGDIFLCAYIMLYLFSPYILHKKLYYDTGESSIQ